MSTEMINSYLLLSPRTTSDLKANEIWQQANQTKTGNYLNHPDFNLIDSQTSIGIEEIRKLKQQIFKKPYLSTFKAVYFPQAEKLTPVSQNALLKILEEPPSHTIIILATDQPEKLLTTVVSRCLVVKESRKPVKINQEISQFWQEIANKNPGQKLLTIDIFSKNRQQAREFCQESLLFFHQQLISQKSAKKKAGRHCQHLLTAIKQLEANCQPALVLGVLVCF